jgi:hypothetical protein
VTAPAPAPAAPAPSAPAPTAPAPAAPASAGFFFFFFFFFLGFAVVVVEGSESVSSLSSISISRPSKPLIIEDYSIFLQNSRSILANFQVRYLPPKPPEPGFLNS